jgi:hypothetical protein
MKVVILLWLWWSERNAVREGDRRGIAGELAYVVHKNAVEFLELVMSHLKPPQHQTPNIAFKVVSSFLGRFNLLLMGFSHIP